MQGRLECGEIFDYSSIGRWYNVVKAERNVIVPDGRIMTVRIHMNCGNLDSTDPEKQKALCTGESVSLLKNWRHMLA